MKSCGQYFWAGLSLLSVVVLVLFFVIPPVSHAIPAFTRKYNVKCTICHTRPPRLNSYGERFLENGYQLPGTEEGGSLGEKAFGALTLEDITNHLAIRLRGNVLRSVDFDNEGSGGGIQGSPKDKTEFSFPEIASFMVAGTFFHNIGVFVEVETDLEEDHTGLERGFITLNNIGKHDVAHLRVGRIDPSAFWSYPTARQQLMVIGDDRDEHGDFHLPTIDRIALSPAAFAAKFSGLFERDGTPILPYQPALYNAVSEVGIDLYGRPFGDGFLYQVGIVNGANEDFRDSNTSKDWYVMMRLDHARSHFFSSSLSGFAYFGNRNAKLTTRDNVNWERYGLAGNIRYKMVDLYGAFVLDRVTNLPSSMTAQFDKTATGTTVEGDVLVTDHLMFSLRVDHLDAGGTVANKKSNTLLGMQAKYYLYPNFSVSLRHDRNLRKADGGVTPGRNFRQAFFIGVDLIL